MYADPSEQSDSVGSSFVSEQQKHGGRAAISSHRLSAAKGETGGVRDWLKSSAILSSAESVSPLMTKRC